METFKILWVNPVPQMQEKGSHKDIIHFRLCIRTVPTLDPSDFIVRIWTNLCHKEHNEGEWHVVPMVYQDVAIKSDSGFVDYLFGADLMMTAKGKFGFNYRAICKKLKKSERSNTHGEIQVKLSSLFVPMTEWIQYPMQAQITKNIWIGNHAAALEAHRYGFDCLINTADDANVYVLKLNAPIILRKFPISQGVNNIISDKRLHTAVRWLWEASTRCDKILVFSKYGCARSASILIAYIYARNRDLSFADAVKFVDCRIPIYYHTGLKASLERLYPRA
ncbi:hypothetical protein RRG08_023605 [Elysia crispata]|uniref:Uncharacterized protein n=1 Tax=Elysia crispata TaxID=231223 RepID=A0AAE0XTP8_9GAST|nr:hypothetical protein RRG08_023605 [Elysia crispata]